MKHSIIPEGLTGKALYDFLVKHEALIFHAKKSAIKYSDEAYSVPLYINEKGQLVDKAEIQETQIDPTKIKAVLVINTTNWYDSHGDVHIPGLWKKTLSDNNKVGFYLLNSHNRGFEDVIAEGCQAQAKSMSWKDLGLDLLGTTEALVFTCIIDETRNEYMFGQYQKGYVKKHSVGMRYVKMVTCIDDDDYPVQKENWDKYIEMVANKADAMADGYFWAILEAQIVEGSAVLFASNCVTPTLDVQILGTKNEPLSSTQEEPPQFDLMKAIKSMIMCPSCVTIFNASDSGAANCPACGQYVSPSNSSAETGTFDLKAAIAETKFI